MVVARALRLTSHHGMQIKLSYEIPLFLAIMKVLCVLLIPFRFSCFRDLNVLYLLDHICKVTYLVQRKMDFVTDILSEQFQVTC